MVNPTQQFIASSTPDLAEPGQDATAFAIQVRALRKWFKTSEGTLNALNGVSFDVPRDKVFAILGPNGAGKTTLLRILTTVMRPSSGQAWVEGVEVGRGNIRIRKSIGVVAQDNHFDRYLTAWQNLMLHAQMHGMSKKEAEQRIMTLLDKVEMTHRRNDYMEDFSGGMQRRMALIRALIHQPTLLFLDEPTTGLDPAARLEIWQTIQELREKNTTVILTTHYMEEADRLSDRLMIMNHGEVVMTGTSQELKNHMSPPDTYELQLRTATGPHYLHQLESWIKEAKVCEDSIHFKLKQPDMLSAVVARIDPADFRAIGLAQADLETVYLRVAREAKAEWTQRAEKGGAS